MLDLSHVRLKQINVLVLEVANLTGTYKFYKSLKISINIWKQINLGGWVPKLVG